MSVADDGGIASCSAGGWEKLGNGVPGFSSQLKGTEAISLVGVGDGGTAAGSAGGWDKLGNGVPVFSSQLKGTEVISLIGVGDGNVVVTEEAAGFQSLFAMPGLTSQRNGTEGGCLIFLLLDCPAASFSAILKYIKLSLCWIVFVCYLFPIYIELVLSGLEEFGRIKAPNCTIPELERVRVTCSALCLISCQREI